MFNKVCLSRSYFKAALTGLSLLAVIWSEPSHGQSAVPHEGEVIFAFFGGTLEQQARNHLIPQFEKATGIKVRLVVGTSQSNYTKVLATRNNPEIDVVSLSEVTHIAAKQLGLINKLDPKIVTNLNDLYDEVRDPDGIGAPIYAYATGIMYNSQALAAAGIPVPSSWNDLWDPRLKGKVALYNFNVSYSQDFLALINRALGGTEKDISAGLEKIKTLKTSGNLAMFASSPAELDNMLVQGQAWITVNGSTRAYILKQRGAPIDFAYPKEGAGYYTSYFDIVKNAPHPKAAQLLLNYLIGPEAQAAIGRNALAAPVNKKVQLSGEIRELIPSADRLKSLVQLDRAEMNLRLDHWAEGWNRQIEAK